MKVNILVVAGIIFSGSLVLVWKILVSEAKKNDEKIKNDRLKRRMAKNESSNNYPNL